jgi:hypothetical protein
MKLLGDGTGIYHWLEWLLAGAGHRAEPRVEAPPVPAA